MGLLDVLGPILSGVGNLGSGLNFTKRAEPGADGKAVNNPFANFMPSMKVGGYDMSYIPPNVKDQLSLLAGKLQLENQFGLGDLSQELKRWQIESIKQKLGKSKGGGGTSGGSPGKKVTYTSEF